MKISVIIPIYNVALYIEQCLTSVVNQTIDDMEVILVDDCGTDNSIEIAENFINNYKGNVVFKLLHHKKNRGLSASRNTGIDAASGDYISFIDSDDYVAPKMFELLLNEIEKNDTYGISSCLPKFVNENGEEIIDNKLYNSNVSKVVEPHDFFVQWFTYKIWHTAWGKLYKRDLFSMIRFCEGINNEDIRFCVDAYQTIEQKGYKLVEIPQKLYFYRQRENSITKETKDNLKKLNFDIVTNNSLGVEILNAKDKDEYNVFIRHFCNSWWGIILQIRRKSNLHRYYRHYQKMANIIPDDIADEVISKYGKADSDLFFRIKYKPLNDRLLLMFHFLKNKYLC